MRQNYFLAICDILRFSALVKESPLEIVVDNVLGWFRRALNHSVLKSEFPEVVPAASDLDRHEHVGVAWFSDTLLFYTKSDTDAAARELLATVAWLVFEAMVDGRTRVRAGIAYGEAYIDPQNSLFVGNPIVEAYCLEKAQQWSGGALSQSACDRLPENVLSADWWVVQYDVPLKDGKTHRTLALNWNTGIHLPGWRLRWSAQSNVPSEADWEKERSVCEKFVNTKRFHEANCDDCRYQSPAAPTPWDRFQRLRFGEDTSNFLQPRIWMNQARPAMNAASAIGERIVNVADFLKTLARETAGRG